MGLYASYIEPALVSFACSLPPLRRERAKIIPEAAGAVLEIGFGSGHNAPYYDPAKVERLIALEPSRQMRARAARRVGAVAFPFSWLDLKAEEIPLDAASVDTVVTTFTLCTIPDAARALTSVRRVLKPSGRLLFLEHGAAPDPGVRRLQDQLDPVWGRLAGGCRLSRDPLALIAEAGFGIARSQQRYAAGAPRFAGFLTSGVAIA
ncbi:MAG TPA: SAM-dependent methyltransferase [Parvularcula sp.]|nr:SAM-dependent methyltransferase [Parvularcula sp.]HBS30545.1 SAM-dependent methyltransferase [Parvularcula sp.]